mmetsp:Transcript_31906/g.99372  ORF Transcript_31906/g.99372 Transcript_31906/m.99372 type:complete len:211 (-) Transcript_31906:221-853(-)
MVLAPQRHGRLVQVRAVHDEGGCRFAVLHLHNDRQERLIGHGHKGRGAVGVPPVAHHPPGLGGAETAIWATSQGDPAAASRDDLEGLRAGGTAAVAVDAARPGPAEIATEQGLQVHGTCSHAPRPLGQLHQLEHARRQRVVLVACYPALWLVLHDGAEPAARGPQGHVLPLEGDGGLASEAQPPAVHAQQLHLVAVVQPGVVPWEAEAAA